MKVIPNDLTKHEQNAGAEYITILPLADFHIGDVLSDKKTINSLLGRIKNEPNTYCILGGDLMNTALATSVSDSYSEVLTPLDQISKCEELFAPIKDKILGIVGGNHEARTWRTAGLDTTAIFAKQLGILDKYSDTTAVITVKTGWNPKGRPQQYTIYLAHGAGGGRKPGGKINRLVDFGQIVDTDVYVCGHTHSPAIVRQQFMRVNYNNFSLTSIDRLFVNTAAALNYGGYGDTQGYTPASNKYPEIRLYNRVRRTDAVL